MKKGQITVFFSLIIIIVFSITGSIMEMARKQMTKSRILGIVDMGIDSVFAEYHVGLLEEFDLFFVDGCYDMDRFSEENVIQRMHQYMSYNIDPEKGLVFTNNNDLQRYQLNLVGLDKLHLATDEDGAVMKDQAIQYMENKMGVETLQKLMKKRHFYEEAEEAGSDYESASKNNQSRMDELEQEKEESGYADEESTVEDPLQSVEELKALSILNLVCENKEELSDKKLAAEQLPTNRSLNSGYGERSKKEDDSELIGNILFHEYLLEKMGNAVSPVEQGGLSYEIEYIISGKDSDMENLESVVHKILLMREGINFLYLLSDTAKREEALVLATTLVGAIPLPGLVPAVQTAILLAWAYGESILEMKSLLKGGKIPTIKTNENWRLQLSNLGDLLNQDDETGEDQEGMSYQDYLRLLLFLGQGQEMRSIDMIECRIRMQEGGEQFRMDQCIGGLTVNTNWNIKEAFFFYSFQSLEQLSEVDIVYDFSYEVQEGGE